MAETAPAAVDPPAEVAPKKKQKKAAGASKAKKPSGPSVSDLILKVVTASAERKGVSLAAVKKALIAGGYDADKNKSRVKAALKSLVSKGALAQLKGTGASGSFKVNKKQLEGKKAAKKTAAKSKKPAAKKAAPAAKKPKKAPAGVKKSPKKVKKPAAAKSPKKPKAAPAKKAAKSPAKAKAAKPKVAKKSPAKVVKPKAAKPKVAKPKKAAPKKK